jgi:hypothetical protein
MFRANILPVIRQNSELFASSAEKTDEELIELAHRMGSTIMAYAFDLENEDEQDNEDDEEWVEDREGETMLGMVPMADILNADAEFNVSDLVKSLGLMSGLICLRPMSTTAMTLSPSRHCAPSKPARKS